MNVHCFSGKTALVTGGSRGIGRACCLRLAHAGANVAVNYLSNETAALETVRLANEAGGRGLAVQSDVSSSDDVDRMIAQVTTELGPIDLLVNNAGVFDYVSHLERLIDATPLKRIGTPEEIAALVFFLLSDESSFTTGQTIVSSGGRVMRP
jgi:NAD(P)-dependent dehydrogenase (short-subunit alcohol dehydrogenase family)